MKSVEVLFTPAELGLLKQRDLSDTICVVFDVLRATSSMVTALANGAAGIIPVEEIPEALAIRDRLPAALLAGERNGSRISAKLTGSIDFDLGNSPREFTRDAVQERTIVMTTTNGTRALRACAHASMVVASSLLNLAATGRSIAEQHASHLLLVCGGTFEEAAYEDTLAAGGLCEAVFEKLGSDGAADSALMACALFQLAKRDLLAALSQSRNGRRLLARPELGDDVAFCSRRDSVDLVAELNKDGMVRKR